MTRVLMRRVATLLSMPYGMHACRNVASTGLQDTYIAIGSNVGDRVEAFKEAISQLRLLGNVTATSFLYETPPMYVTDQEKFLNAACHLQTSLQPDELLKALKAVEQLIGRKHSYRNGPRLIDIDIIMYGSRTVSTIDLQIPHIRLHERAFVLRPLCDINPNLMHPTMNCTVSSLLHALPESDRSSMRRVVPVGKCSSGLTRLVDFGSRTFVCGVLNITPDSDGGEFETISAAVKHSLDMLDGGADMIDIGGESTRPGSAVVSVEAEANRVVPVIRALRAAGVRCPISVDTRNAEVAKEAVLAGADLVNDVSGGRHDPSMLSTIAELQVPVIMMHMRGTPQTMASKEFTEYQTGDCIAEIAAGEAENLLILKKENLTRLITLLGNRPMLFGSSRKRFLGAILKRTAISNPLGDSAGVDLDIAGVSKIKGQYAEKERAVSMEQLDWATAATTAAAVIGESEKLSSSSHTHTQ